MVFCCISEFDTECSDVPSPRRDRCVAMHDEIINADNIKLFILWQIPGHFHFHFYYFRSKKIIWFPNCICFSFFFLCFWRDSFVPQISLFFLYWRCMLVEALGLGLTVNEISFNTWRWEHSWTYKKLPQHSLFSFSVPLNDWIRNIKYVLHFCRPLPRPSMYWPPL